MASLIYNSFLEDVFKGNIDVDSDTFYCLLVTSSYTPDKDTDTKRSDITNEVIGVGYTTKGTVAVLTVTNDTANDRLDVSLGAVSWLSATITAAAAVYYKYRDGVASADELVAYIDFGDNVISTNGTFALTASTLRIQN